MANFELEADELVDRFEHLLAVLIDNDPEVSLHSKFIDFAELHGLLIDPVDKAYSVWCRKVAAARVIRHLKNETKVFPVSEPLVTAEELFAKHFSSDDVIFGMLNPRMGEIQTDELFESFRGLDQASGMVRVIATLAQDSTRYGHKAGVSRARHFMSYDPFGADFFSDEKFQLAKGYSDAAMKLSWLVWGCSAPFHAAVSHEEHGFVFQMQPQHHDYVHEFVSFLNEIGISVWLGRALYLQQILDETLSHEIISDPWRFSIPEIVEPLAFALPELTDPQVRVLKAYAANDMSANPS